MISRLRLLLVVLSFVFYLTWMITYFVCSCSQWLFIDLYRHLAYRPTASPVGDPRRDLYSKTDLYFTRMGMSTPGRPVASGRHQEGQKKYNEGGRKFWKQILTGNFIDKNYISRDRRHFIDRLGIHQHKWVG